VLQKNILLWNCFVRTQSSAPGPQQKRLAAYLDGVAQAAGHADRIHPLKSYCRGLLLPGERKSVEPRAAGLAPDCVGANSAGCGGRYGPGCPAGGRRLGQRPRLPCWPYGTGTDLCRRHAVHDQRMGTGNPSLAGQTLERNRTSAPIAAWRPPPSAHFGRGFHHHATLCIAAYGFLVAERSRFPPWARAGRLEIPAPKLPPGFQPRDRSAAMRTA